MTITLCNSHPFTFYLPFHTSLRADQCPIQSHVPSTCTLGLDPCARHSLFGRTDPYYIDNFYSSCGLKRLAATLASPLLCNCTVLPVPLSTGPYLVIRNDASTQEFWWAWVPDHSLEEKHWIWGGPLRPQSGLAQEHFLLFQWNSSLHIVNTRNPLPPNVYSNNKLVNMKVITYFYVTWQECITICTKIVDISTL